MKSSKVRSFVAASAAVVAAHAMGQQAVEWKLSDGGNGHWYDLTQQSVPSWHAAQQGAIAQGGHLATLGSQQEAAFVAAIAYRRSWYGGWIGLKYLSGSWVWVTGEPLVDIGPYNLRVSGDGPCGNFIDLQPGAPFPPGLNDIACEWIAPYFVEWDADCNADGIVDYGQILAGELADTNSDGVPDCCEDGSGCSPSLIVNSGFESGSPLNACAVESVAAGNLVASGWQVSAGVVDRVRGGAGCTTSTQPRYGDYCVDLCGTPASSGAIKQFVPTIPAHRYRCTFSLSGDASAGPSVKKVHAKVGTYVDLTFTFACTGTGAQGWVSNQFEFTARGANEPLEFVADNGVTTGGPMLDAISLIDITTQCVGDLDGDADVNGADMALLLLNWGPCQTSP